MLWKKIVIPAACCLALTAGALLLQAQTSLSLSDMWIRFPDGTVQETAAHNCFNPDDPMDEMIRVGGVCIDKYEASLWDAPVDGNEITGTIPCSPNGQDCDDIYARSVAGVMPRADISWFQAQAALANSGKRLPTNAEWQMAVRGTPDGFPCNVNSGGPAFTGSSPNCISDFGAIDMVGNVGEWVADWVADSTGCPGWDSSFSDDLMCLSAASETNQWPGALIRGGTWAECCGGGANAGPFAVQPSQPYATISESRVGFRGAR